MNIFDFAIGKEREAEEIYRNMAEKTPDIGLRNILTMLADDEKKHASVIENMKAETDPYMADTPILTDAKNIFIRMKESEEGIRSDTSQLELYRKAQQMERQSEEYYRQKEMEAVGPGRKALFGKLADEEKKHFLLLHHIIEMVSRPETWVENAEFFHLDEY